MSLHRKIGPRKYEDTNLPDVLRRFEAHSMLIAATRYYTGRRTIGACDWADRLASAWPEIPEGTRAVIRRDLETEFKDDDEARARGDQYKPLGDDCDRQAWEKVRQAWQIMGVKNA